MPRHTRLPTVIRLILLIAVAPRFAPSAGAAAPPELVVQAGHANTAASVACSPDGRTVASGSPDGTVMLWEVQTGALKRTLRGHGSGFGPAVNVVAYSPDGSTLASGGEDHTVRLWDPATGALRRVLRGHEGSVVSLSFSGDGRTLAAGGNDATAVLWGTETGEVQRVFKVSAGQVQAALSPGGGTLAVSSQGSPLVNLYSTQTGAVRRILEGRVDWAQVLAFSPDGTTIASGGADGTVRLWNTQSGAPQQTWAVGHGTVLSLSFAPDGQKLAMGGSGAGGDGIQIWSVATGTRLLDLAEPHPADEVHLLKSVAFSPDGTAVASAGDDERVRLWGITASRPRWTSAFHSAAVAALAFHGDLLASGHGDDTARLWDLQAGRLRQTLETPTDAAGQTVTSLGFTPDGRQVATRLEGDPGGSVYFWDTRSGKRLRVLKTKMDSEGSRIAFSPDGRLLAASGQFLQLFSTGTGALKRVRPNHGDYSGVAFSPDGRLVACGRDIWETEAGRLRLTLPPSRLPVTFLPGIHAAPRNQVREFDVSAVTFSPDGLTVATGAGSADARSEEQLFEPVGAAVLWDVRTGRLLRLLPHQARVLSLAYAPDGRTLATGGEDGSVRLWDPETGRPRHLLAGQGDRVNAVAFSGDGALLASGSADETICLWSVRTGRLLLTLRVLPAATELDTTTDWIAYTPEGYYEGSPDVAKFIRWRVGDALFPAASRSAQFHQPERIQQALRGAE